MRNRKGFSLIELLAVLVIIGLILLIVIPATSRLLTNNESKEYNNYLKIIETGAKVYADDKKDDLGTSIDTGCIEVDLEDLINEQYIKAFDDKKVTCSGKVRLNNNKGNLEVSTNIACVDDKGKETFKKDNIDDSSCVAFVPREEGGLKNQLIKNGFGSGYTSKYDNKNYVRGSNPNNYVWYSGKLWRVVYYDDEAVKLISNDIVTVMSRNYNTSINYKGSLVQKWLEGTFLSSLKEPNKYLVNTKWNMNPTSGMSFLPGNDSQYIVASSKVGLLNSYDVSKMGNFMDSTYYWLIGNHYSTYIRLSNRGGNNYTTKTFNGNDYYAIRAAITMKPDVYVIGGNGSSSNPYILEGNSTNIPTGTLINTRYSGEYLKINNVLYRIVKVKNNLTKVIMVDSLGEQTFYDSKNNSYDYSLSALAQYLNDEWYMNDLGDYKELIYKEGAWCYKYISGAVNFSDTCAQSYTFPVGIPSLGDLYTANNDGKTDTFWTIDPYNTLRNMSMNAISSDTRIDISIFGKAKVKPVMYLKSNVVIESGQGTKDSPFKLTLK